MNTNTNTNTNTNMNEVKIIELDPIGSGAEGARDEYEYEYEYEKEKESAGGDEYVSGCCTIYLNGTHCALCSRRINRGEKCVIGERGAEALCADCMEEMTLSDFLYFIGFDDVFDLLEDDSTDLVVEI